MQTIVVYAIIAIAAAAIAHKIYRRVTGKERGCKCDGHCDGCHCAGNNQ